MTLAEYHKVNRCLARYSPRATTTNRPTNRAPKKPAWPGPNWPKMPILGQIWSFLGKKSFFYWRNQKFCYPHNGKPTQASCSHCFLVRHGTKWAKNANIWDGMDKMLFLVPQNRIFGSWVPKKQTDFFTPVKTWMDSIICLTMEYQPSCDITLLARHISFVEYWKFPGRKCKRRFN